MHNLEGKQLCPGVSYYHISSLLRGTAMLQNYLISPQISSSKAPATSRRSLRAIEHRHNQCGHKFSTKWFHSWSGIAFCREALQNCAISASDDQKNENEVTKWLDQTPPTTSMPLLHLVSRLQKLHFSNLYILGDKSCAVVF